MLKISQPVIFSPHPPLYQLGASCRNLVSTRIGCNRVICFIHDGDNGRNSAQYLKYGHVVYTICILNFISMKNSKYQL